MKNKIITLLFILLIKPVYAENLNIQSSEISINKKTQLTVFKNKVTASDEKGNVFKTNLAEYKKDQKLLESKGKTTILTSEGFFLTGENITFDNLNKSISSDYPATIKDLENNIVYLEKFQYSTADKFFKSTGNIKVIDAKNNSYNFSQIFIDEVKREIIGTDIKAFLNDEGFKIQDGNKPRVFSNTVKITDDQNKFTKSVFTLCDYRENDKCPPWSIQSSQMLHDKKKKTIYYDNAVIKVYDLPIFYLPKLSHPDPSVDRRSGFLTPAFSDSKNLGAGFKIPYFWAIDKDKDLTFTSKLYTSQHPLFLGEFRHAFEKSNLVLDFGYTQGYKKTTKTKNSGDKSHFFSKFVKNFKGKNNSDNNLEVSLQHLSHDKYLKLYKIRTDLIENEVDVLENSLNFNHENENFFLGFKASAYETLKDEYNDKYEYVLPDIVFDKNLFSNSKFGNADLQSNLKIHNYDTNVFTKFLVNDVDWKYKKFNYSTGINGQILGKFKNVNYEAKNTLGEYKEADLTNEMFGAVGYLSEIDFYKDNRDTNHLLTPKMLLRYAPGHMRKARNGPRLKHNNIFSLDRLNIYNNFESGLSTTLGFDYTMKNSAKELNLSVGQVVNEKENKNMPSSTSLDEKLSDLIGHSNLKVNENLTFNYDFALDQNYNDLNYNELGTSLDFQPIKFDLSYLQEKKHIGDQEYIKTNIEVEKGQNGIFAFETKRNLVTSSAEYYNLSYEYLNDCLKAGLVYRREFYTDSEIEAENSLMFKITLTPFGNLSSPSFN